LQLYGRAVRPTTVTPSPKALRALSHPTRLRMLGLLRREGPATATTLAARVGVNTGAASYHLRQLAEHGFIEEDAERGTARDRWWRAVHQTTRIDTAEVAPEERDVLDAYLQTVAVTHAQTLQAAMEEQAVLPEEWRNASTVSDYHVRLSPAAARRLLTRLDELLSDVAAEESDDAADVVVQLHAFPRPGQLGGEPR
jgi:DNA-binding transcriptional ArsR family regulator